MQTSHYAASTQPRRRSGDQCRPSHEGAATSVDPASKKERRPHLSRWCRGRVKKLCSTDLSDRVGAYSLTNEASRAPNFHEFIYDLRKEFIYDPRKEFIYDPRKEFIYDPRKEFISDPRKEFIYDPRKEFISDPRKEM
ncbi:hypothetical protein LSAT2_009674 [Lamellibrachia satsuma]|nr:hypothetical protein LSAT2_009674 [Lamellibrachia satsuma]